jgi:hypothetical protein
LSQDWALVPKKMGQAKSRIAGEAALPVEDGGNAVGLHIQLARQLRGAHPQFVQLLGKVLSGMNNVDGHRVLLKRESKTVRRIWAVIAQGQKPFVFYSHSARLKSC